jgi:hypothetical protein
MLFNDLVANNDYKEVPVVSGLHGVHCPPEEGGTIAVVESAKANPTAEPCV